MNILVELEKLRRHHTYCDDCWYSCPKAEDGCCNDQAGDECNCGADKHNAILDGIIAFLCPNNAVHLTPAADALSATEVTEPQAQVTADR